jgi:hypothetical protein
VSLPPSQPKPMDDGLVSERRERRRRQYRVRTLMMASVVAAVWMGLLRLPGVMPLVGGALVVAGGILAIFLGAMALSFVGIGLFALFDRAVARAKGAGPKPGPVDDWWA